MEPPRLLSQLRPEKINRCSRSRDGFISAKRREPFLRPLLRLLLPPFHAPHGLILHLPYLPLPPILFPPPAWPYRLAQSSPPSIASLQIPNRWLSPSPGKRASSTVRSFRIWAAPRRAVSPERTRLHRPGSSPLPVRRATCA